MAHTQYLQTNAAINKLNREFADIHSQVLGIVNALTASHDEILTNTNHLQDPLALETSQICSI